MIEVSKQSSRAGELAQGYLETTVQYLAQIGTLKASHRSAGVAANLGPAPCCCVPPHIMGIYIYIVPQTHYPTKILDYTVQ